MPTTNSIHSSTSSGQHSTNTKNSANANPAPVEPLYQVKLLQALRSGDPALIHPFLAEIGKDRRKSVEAGVPGSLDTGAAALHLAVRCASVDTVALLLSHRAISPNGIHPPGSGTTPLHLAASLGRVDIVNLLLEQDGINDTLRDAQGRTCRDVAKGREVAKAIEDSHSFLNASYRSLLRSYVLSPPTAPPAPPLLALLESPASASSTSPRRKDLRLIELAVRAGADVFVRNRRGKMAGEGAGGAGKDDRVRVFLRQFANHDTTLIDPPSTPASHPPVMKGYLNKYTNVAKGYSTRWFVLKNGIFSYYRTQQDETVASRGSISMKTAVLRLSASDRCRFEVHAGAGASASQKWYVKANHPVEAARWTAALRRSVEWWGQREGEGGEGGVSEGGGGEGGRRRRSAESEESALRSGSGSGSVKSVLGRVPSGTKTKVGVGRLAAGTGSLLRRERDKGARSASGASGASSGMDTAASNNSIAGVGDDGLTDAGDEDADADDADGEGEGGGDEESSDAESSGRVPPHEAAFELHGNTTAAQLELTGQLLANLGCEEGSAELKGALRESFAVVQGLVNEYVGMVREREAWWRRQLERERRRQRVWEESLATVVREGETLERELRDGGGGCAARGVVQEEGEEEEEEEGKGYFPDDTQAAKRPGEAPPRRSHTQDTVTLTTPLASHAQSPPPPQQPPLHSSYDGSDGDTDEEDEFFDAIESGTLPNLVVPAALSPRPSAFSPTSPFMPDTAAAAYAGYRTLRMHLELTAERPNTSLWSVLKHSIGKDLTKISFPVFFNEPTSMLQRMAEDMEFSECLDAAARDKDPLRRIAFVAAFAMSNYSSTIGRIAKPFNPMLSETFEYVRLDKQYRYVSEQVSHHPPISACWAESPSWHYYGEVDAQNKFMGKSFEIRPTGVAHAELLIPAERGGDGYPKAPKSAGGDKVVEHYSWKKVTTNISGFILGSPTIDHYGDMIITNHRTGDQCILTFKPRGWRGKDAYEIAGEVVDADGRVAYKIAGRWNSQLIACPAGSSSSSFLNPDLEVDGAASPGASSSAGAPFVLWRNSEKRAGSPFNLTPFAITLNDCPPDTLRPYVCPTDCRLRPDQRAFEMGRWELANELKNRQEEKQRAVRRARQEGRSAPHRPRWFRAETDGDTGERVWTPSRVDEALEYWVERERVYRAGGAGKATWKEVDDIFIETPDSVLYNDDGEQPQDLIRIELTSDFDLLQTPPPGVQRQLSGAQILAILFASQFHPHEHYVHPTCASDSQLSVSQPLGSRISTLMSKLPRGQGSSNALIQYR
ncbi:putative OSBP family protein [Lyophyllum shimeji]|uniref:OSBP family protein n=1 Tax=Lyophyllum shimeji TaxID=47721 RepID=A0A9P3PP60_LYOSH|nr:putative OSBP family protein [Lyophyllum shimeji]